MIVLSLKSIFTPAVISNVFCRIDLAVCSHDNKSLHLISTGEVARNQMTMIEWKLNLELRMTSSGITGFNA